MLIAQPQRKKKKGEEEEPTQVLEVLPDPPQALKVETSRLVFHASPMSNKGLLSQQVRDGIRAIWKVNNKAIVVKLRALVAGTGDLRRVQTIVSEMFSEKRLPLPVVNVVQVGVLPMEGVQVILEAASITKKPVNPNGLAFISGQGASEAIDPDKPHMRVAGLARKSVENLRTALASVSATPKDVLRTTCYTSSLEDHGEVRSIVLAEFPQAPLVIAQNERSPARSLVECEVVARLPKKPAAALELINPPQLTSSPNFSHVAAVGASQIVLTGTQLAFRAQDADVKRAFERLQATLEQAGSSIKNVAMSNIYPLSDPVRAKVSQLRFEFYDRARPPASTMILFQGLPSLDASFGIDVVAVSRD